jgi:hypothetical protein
MGKNSYYVEKLRLIKKVDEYVRFLLESNEGDLEEVYLNKWFFELESEFAVSLSVVINRIERWCLVSDRLGFDVGKCLLIIKGVK